LEVDSFDIVIAGGGPAGSTLALKLAASGYRIAILEKDVFPRDKICGDALSGQVVNILKRMDGGVFDRFVDEVPKISSAGIRFVAPSGRHADIPFNGANGYVCRRRDFDQFLWKEVERTGAIEQYPATKITRVLKTSNHLEVITGSRIFRTRMLAAADGVHSVVRRTLFPSFSDEITHCLGLRAYFRNISGLHPSDFIELHFLKEVLPGYLWVFNGTGGLVNVGLGLLQSRVKRKKINLKSLAESIIRDYPPIAGRFGSATQVSTWQAHPLPLFSGIRPLSTNRCILLGDAAALVDPFTGEGIGNAMASAETAARIILGRPEKDDFSKDYLTHYDHAIRKRMAGELQISSWMQRLARAPYLINLFVKRAQTDKKFNDLLSSMYANDKQRAKFTSPLFYLKTLLGL